MRWWIGNGVYCNKSLDECLEVFGKLMRRKNMKEFKIQIKGSFNTFMCQDESESYYIGCSQKLYSKFDYERIPDEPKWVDVTHELVITEPIKAFAKSTGVPGQVSHNGIAIANLTCGGKYKVKMVNMLGFSGSALKVEMKQ